MFQKVDYGFELISEKILQWLSHNVELKMRGNRMKRISKSRIKSPFLLAGILSMFVFMIISWGFGSLFFEVMSYTEDYIMENSGNSKSEYLDMILPSILTWENSWLGAFIYLVNLFPLFPCIVALGFSRELKGYFPYAVLFMKSGKRTVRKTCLCYALLGGLVVTITLLLGNAMLAPFAKVSLVDIGGADDFFSKNFYVLHPFFVFNVLACTIYFELGFAFSLMACSVALWKNNSVVILGVPFLFYHLENFVSSQLGGFLPLWSADSVLAFNTEHNILELSVPLIVIMIISVLLIEIKIHSRKGWVIQ